VNPRAGKEGEYTISTTTKPKRVLVIGGGPAGLEAAKTAALRGHQVTLWEEGERLGGTLLTASVPPHKSELSQLAHHLSRQVEKSGIQVELNKIASVTAVEEMKPEAVIIATGASPIIPEIPGVKGRNVITAVEVLQMQPEVGQKVVVIGGGMVGCETAEFLASKGKKVTIIEMLDRIGIDIGPTTRWVILRRLRDAGVAMETKLKAEEITDEGVIASRDGATIFLPADTVVLAVGMKPNKELAQALKEKVENLYVIGDCHEPRRIKEAIEEGFVTGLRV
jgi:pyruvate/2-oxoglutarate dehydrogenase complex dihydrolipoamide dehydrogenase (E3) component